MKIYTYAALFFFSLSLSVCCAAYEQEQHGSSGSSDDLLDVEQQEIALRLYYGDYPIDNRLKMVDMVNNTDIPDEDKRIIMNSVIDDDTDMSGNGVRDLPISDKSFEQIMDDAKF